MNTLHVTVTNKTAAYSRRDGRIVCRNKDYQIQFTFDEEWAGIDEKTARFIWGGKYYDVEFTGDTCPVPEIYGTTVLKVGVYAGDLQTTTDAVIECTPSILCKSGVPHPESVAPDINEAKEAAATATNAANTANAAAETANASATAALNHATNAAKYVTFAEESEYNASRHANTAGDLANQADGHAYRAQCSAEDAQKAAEEAKEAAEEAAQVVPDGFEIVQTTGESETAAMSQKAVTDAVNRDYAKNSMLLDGHRNLWDGYCISNMVIQSSSGKEITHNSYRTTRAIEVLPNTKYTLYGWNKCDYYDANMNHLPTHFTNNSGRVVITTPETCKYARFGTEVQSEKQQIYLGEVDASAGTYKQPSIKENYMPDSVVYATNNTVNRFNGVVFGDTGIDDTTGNTKELTAWRTSEYIPVLPNQYYTAYKWTKVAFYKNDYSFISASYCQSTPTFKVPSECYYIRLTTSLTSRKQMLVAGERNDVLYVPYKETIPSEMLDNPIWKEKTYFYDDLNGWANAPEQVSFNPTTVEERSVESIYGIYDDLMEENPGYITKEDLGLDQSDTYHLYAYTFKPEQPKASVFESIETKHLPKIVLCVGIHGLERWGTYAIAHMMKAICNNPDNDHVFDYLRNGVEFVVVPIVNPWGYVNATQWNKRGVNICRNFGNGWSVSGANAFTYDYEGANAFSEAETRHITKVLNENLDALAVIDVHNHDITKWEDTYWINGVRSAVCYSDVVAIASNTIKRLTNSLKSNYNKNFEGFAGYSEGITPRGSLQSQAVEYGLNAMVAECVDKLVGEVQSGTPLTNQVNVEFYANLIAQIIKHYQ